MTSTRLASSRDLFVASEQVFGSRHRSLPAVLRHTNAVAIGLDRFACSMLRRTHRPREAAYEDVIVGRLPPSTRLLGGGHGWVEADGTLVAEQMNPLTERMDVLLDFLRGPDWPTIDIDEQCLLVSRYGETTWGHWLCEILPRAVVAERAFPNRFRYAVPEAITERTTKRGYATAVLESLRAYGIGEDRLLRLRNDAHYRFGALHLPAALWSPCGIHPDVVDTLRAEIDVNGSPVRRLAVLRNGAATRNVFNHPEIAAVLRAEGFRFLDPVATPFGEQVAAFRAAEMIFGVVGSGMSGLLYARDGVRVIGAAPGAWPDSYFQSVMQLRDARFADLRGPAVWTGAGIERDAPFVVNPGHLQEAVAALDSEPPPEIIRLGAFELPRRLGQPILRVDFSVTGNSAAFRVSGWSMQEAAHVWSEGRLSTLVVPSGLPTGALILELTLAAPVMRPYLVSRPIDIAANGTPLGRFDVEDQDTILCMIPDGLVGRDGSLALAFGHPLCLPASAFGAVDDDRLVSTAFISLTIRLP